MLNVQGIRRNVINVVKNYSDAQVKVRRATSNEPWGPSATLMSEIADLTYNVVAFSEIMQIIWKRLNDHGKNWRHVYKALVLLEYLIKTGSEKVAQQCRDNLFAIQTLKDFQYFEEHKDQGISIREKSKLLVNLLKDEEKLKVERSRALKAKERFSQSLSYLGASLEPGEQAFKSSSSYPESLAQGEGTSRSLNSEIESTRPQTAGEEKLQLELALAMSKEEAEQEERLRKNDDLRLKLALEESEKNAKPKSESAVDELLSLSTNSVPNKIVPNDPWSTSSLTTSASLLPSPPVNKNKTQNNDPWSAPTLNLNDFDQIKPSTSTFDDPWSSATVPSMDPWSLNNAPDYSNTGTVAKNNPWNSTADDSKTKPLDVLNEPVKANDSNNLVRRTPESFLGPNSNLVNLDALVSSRVQQSTSPNNNPFASTVTPAINPFQANKPSQPTINELRAQNNILGAGGPSPLFNNCSTTNSPSNSSTMFASQSFTQNFAPMYPQLNTNLSTTTGISTLDNNSVWGNFPTQSSAFTSTSPQPNNPFAM